MKTITSSFFVPTIFSGAAAPADNWILAAGVWNDAGIWNDTAPWKDS